MGSSCCCCYRPKRVNIEGHLLEVDRTHTGKVINPQVVTQFLTRAEQNQLRKEVKKLNEVFSAPFNRLDKIVDYLYLTGFGGINVENIIFCNIKHVINVTFELPYYDVPHIDCIKVAVDDNYCEDISVYFDRIADKINEFVERKEWTVIHCMFGKSRSPTLVLAYLMKYKGMSLSKAYKFVRQKRNHIHPNFNFWRQLIRFEDQIKTKTNKLLSE